MIRLLDNKKRANHHWWPKSLQKHWVNSKGKIQQRKGNIIESKNPKNNQTGCHRNTHFLNVGESPWSHSFEDAFNTVDSKGAEVVRQAIDRVQSQAGYRISQMRLTSWFPFCAATTETRFDCLSKDEMHRLTRLAISIVIRSPAFQFKKSIVHPAFPAGKTVDPELGKANIWHYWRNFYNDPQLPNEPISIVFLISGRGQEFVIGDGFYQDVLDRKRFVQTQSEDWQPFFKGGIIFPLSPSICSLILLNSTLDQRLAILSSVETSEINKIICLSSRNEIYFRNQDQPDFEPIRSPNIRTISLNENSFLKSWLDTTCVLEKGR